jgi:peroxiredoxin
MKNKFVISILLLCLTGLMASAQATAATLASAPDFTAAAALAGKETTVSLAELLKKGPVVLYFYPAAFTSGCTVEAHAFAVAMPAFDKLHATVIGMSGDGISKLKQFSTSECNSKFSVASDPGLKIAALYGASGSALGSYAERKTFVIASDGKILKVIEGVSPGDHATLALETLTTVAASKP